MFDLTVDTSIFVKRIDKMLARIDHVKRVEIGVILSKWQVEDMDRKKPFTRRSRAKGQALTVIRPHSLFEMKRSTRFQRRLVRMSKRKRKPYIAPQARLHTSTRPILREELFDKLATRMQELTASIKW
jgi:hypothetical protein